MSPHELLRKELTRVLTAMKYIGPNDLVLYKANQMKEWGGNPPYHHKID